MKFHQYYAADLVEYTYVYLQKDMTHTSGV